MITLKEIDLKVKKGEFICVIGNVGSGKSSLLNAVIGDLLYVSPQILDKYGQAEGHQKEMVDEEELTKFQDDLLLDNENIVIEAPISISGDIAYSQ